MKLHSGRCIFPDNLSRIFLLDKEHRSKTQSTHQYKYSDPTRVSICNYSISYCTINMINHTTFTSDSHNKIYIVESKITISSKYCNICITTLNMINITTTNLGSRKFTIQGHSSSLKKQPQELYKLYEMWIMFVRTFLPRVLNVFQNAFIPLLALAQGTTTTTVFSQ